MGCWNGTCMLTNLPIMVGEKVYIYPMKRKGEVSSMCGNQSLYKTSLIPFMGIYDDYGAAKDCYGEVDLNINMIKANLVEVEQGSNKYHDIAVSRDTFNVDMFFKSANKRRLKYSNYLILKENEDITFTMIREDAVSYLMKNWKFDVYTGKGDDQYDRNVTYDKYDMELVMYVEYIMKYTDEFSLFRIPIIDKYPVSRIISGIEYDNEWLGSYDIRHLILDNIHEGNRVRVLELMTWCLKTLMINNYIAHIRKIWLPVTHMGSQSQEYNEYRLFNKMTDEIITKLDLDEDYNDD